jgi:hypothetical protein
MKMSKTKKLDSFCKDYKKLPPEKRINLILIAKNLLHQQKENHALHAKNIPPQEQKEHGIA